MIKQEFDELAKKVLLVVAEGHNSATAHFIGRFAVEITESFEKALTARHIDLAKKTTSLTEDEIGLLHATPPQVIECIKRVRDRTSMDLKSSKDLVDKTRIALGLM
jgi:ribosomal protein L7/L12